MLWYFGKGWKRRAGLDWLPPGSYFSVFHVSMLEPGFHEPLFNENLDITNGILCPSNTKIYEKEPRYNEPATSLNRDEVPL